MLGVGVHVCVHAPMYPPHACTPQTHTHPKITQRSLALLSFNEAERFRYLCEWARKSALSSFPALRETLNSRHLSLSNAGTECGQGITSERGHLNFYPGFLSQLPLTSFGLAAFGPQSLNLSKGDKSSLLGRVLGRAY